jgi:hypothetical protein
MICVNADSLPVTGHWCFVPRPAFGGAQAGIVAKINQGGSQCGAAVSVECLKFSGRWQREDRVANLNAI